MRSLLAAALAFALAAPALAQTPAPETITFEGAGTPIPYLPGVKVPNSAKLKSLPLAGGGAVHFRTKGGSQYVALVTHMGTTGIVGVGKKGKVTNPETDFRDVEMRIKKSPGARFDSFVAIQAGRRVDNKGNTDPADDETFYDAAGSGEFYLYYDGDLLYPANGTRLVVVRLGADPLNLVKDPYDLTTTSEDFTRIGIFGNLVYDDLVVSYGH